MTASQAIGLATTAMKDGLEYARARKAFGKTIGEYQLIKEKFARIAINMEAAKLMVYRTAWMIEEEKAGTRSQPAGRSLHDEVRRHRDVPRVVDEVIRIYAGNGFAREYGRNGSSVTPASSSTAAAPTRSSRTSSAANWSRAGGNPACSRTGRCTL